VALSRLKDVQFSVALCSPRQRAQRTCELAGLGTIAKVEPDLAEWDYGDYEGQRSPDIARERPGWNIFVDGGPNGESPEMSQRAPTG
jgi:broad specificity phosphatase PhoE